jgi:hypothetical protein
MLIFVSLSNFLKKNGKEQLCIIQSEDALSVKTKMAGTHTRPEQETIMSGIF